MKKLVALVLALVMVMGMTVAFAEEEEEEYSYWEYYFDTMPTAFEAGVNFLSQVKGLVINNPTGKSDVIIQKDSLFDYDFSSYPKRICLVWFYDNYAAINYAEDLYCYQILIGYNKTDSRTKEDAIRNLKTTKQIILKIQQKAYEQNKDIYNAGSICLVYNTKANKTVCVCDGGGNDGSVEIVNGNAHYNNHTFQMWSTPISTDSVLDVLDMIIESHMPK